MLLSLLPWEIANFYAIKTVVINNEPPAHIVIENFSDLKHKLTISGLIYSPIYINVKKVREAAKKQAGATKSFDMS